MPRNRKNKKNIGPVANLAKYEANLARVAQVAFSKPRPIKAKKKKANRQRTGMGNCSDPELAYGCTLCEPFIHGPVKLGWGNLGNSQLGSVVVRGSLTSSAVCTYLIQLNLAVQNFLTPGAAATYCPVIIWESVAAAPFVIGSAFGFGAVNAPALTTQIARMRFVSGAIKAWPLLAMADQPGMVYQCNVPKQGSNDWPSGMTPSQVQSMFDMEEAVGSYGSCYEVQWRPIGIEDFAFNVPAASTGAQGYNGSMPTIMLADVPLSPAATGRPINFEAVIHFEYELLYNAGSAVAEVYADASSADVASTPADFGTTEQVITKLDKLGFDVKRSNASGIRYGNLQPNKGLSSGNVSYAPRPAKKGGKSVLTKAAKLLAGLGNGVGSALSALAA